MSPPRALYNCDRCPAYCCSYPRIVVSAADLRRLARHFEISEDDARRRFAKRGEEPGEVVLRRRRDEVYGSVCRFLHRAERRCTVYKARPRICRLYPGGARAAATTTSSPSNAGPRTTPSSCPRPGVPDGRFLAAPAVICYPQGKFRPEEAVSHGLR